MLPVDLYTPTDEDFDRFEERVLHTIDSHTVQRRNRHRGVLAASAVLLLAGGGATAWVTLASPELQGLSAYCYADASTDSPFTQVGSPTDRIADDGTVTAPAPVIDPAAAAVSNCTAVWAIDFFGTGTPGPYDGGTPHSEPASTPSPAAAPAGETPALQACLRPDGVYAVFPVLPGAENAQDADAFCAAVGLQPPYVP